MFCEGREGHEYSKKGLLGDLADHELMGDYRFTRPMIQNLIEGFANSVFSNKTHRAHALSPETQVIYNVLRLSVRIGHVSALVQCPLGHVVL